MITGINGSKSIYRANINVNLKEEIVIQIKSGIRINIEVSVKVLKNIIVQKRLYLESCYMYL